MTAADWPNYADTDDLCRSLLIQDRSTQFDLQCIVVDNSTDAAVSEKLLSLTAAYDFVSILRPGENTGYFGGLNYALERDDWSNSSCVVICNNDLEFSVDFCKAFVSMKFTDDTFVVCPNVVTVDGIHQNPHVLRPLSPIARAKLDLYFSHYYVAAFLKSMMQPIRCIKPYRLGSRRAMPSGFVHMGIGACYLLLPQFFARFSRLNYPFFLYGEEAFLSAQVHQGGGRLFYCSTLNLRHKERATISKIPARVGYEYARSGYRTYRKLY